MGLMETLLRPFTKVVEVNKTVYKTEIRRVAEADQKSDAAEYSGGGVKPLGRCHLRDLTPGRHYEMQRKANLYWAKHPVVKKCIQNHRNFIAGQGIKVVATGSKTDVRAKLQKLIDRWWCLNGFDAQLAQRVETLSVEGEWIYWAPPAAPNGMFKLAKLLPESIKDVCRDSIDAEMLSKIEFKQPMEFLRADGTKHLEDELAIVNRNWRTDRVEGEVLYLGINRLSGQTRGFSDILAVFDYVHTLDNVVFLESDRVAVQKSFAWKVKLKGSDNSEKIQARKEEILAEGPPESGEIIINNEDEDWEYISPDLNLTDTIEFVKMLQNTVLGGLHNPQHWFSEGGDVNKATSQEMGGPAFAVIRERLAEIFQFFRLALDLAIQRWVDMGLLPDVEPEDLTYVIGSRDPEKEESREDSLQKITETMARAREETFITDDEAARAVRSVYSQSGLGDFPGLPPKKATGGAANVQRNQSQPNLEAGGRNGSPSQDGGVSTEPQPVS